MLVFLKVMYTLIYIFHIDTNFVFHIVLDDRSETNYIYLNTALLDGNK